MVECGVEIPCTLEVFVADVTNYVKSIKVLQPLHADALYPDDTTVWKPAFNAVSPTTATSNFATNNSGLYIRYATTDGIPACYCDMCFNYIRISDFMTGCCPLTYVRDIFRPLTDAISTGDIANGDMEVIIHHLQGKGKCPSDRGFFTQAPSLNHPTQGNACRRTQTAWNGRCYKKGCDECIGAKCCTLPVPCLKENLCNVNMCSGCDFPRGYGYPVGF